MQKRWFVVLMAVVMVLSLSLAGCSSSNSGGGSGSGNGTEAGGNSGGGNGGGDNGGGSGEGTKLTLWTFNEMHAQFYDHMANLWNEENPDRKITLENSVFPYADHHNKLLISLQSGVGAPDIADVEISRFANFLKGTPQLLDYNEYVEPELENLVQSRLDIYAKDGKYYGLPFHVGATVIYYNKEILDQAGVNADDIKTWDDFREAGKKVVESTGIPMTTLETTDQGSFWPLIVQQGGDYVDEEGNVVLDSDINIKTLEYLQGLLEEGIAVAAPGGSHHAEAYYGFMNQGGAASVWMPMWYMGRFTDYMPDLKGKILIRPMPAWEEGGDRSVGIGGTGTVVTNQSQNPELAKEFMAFAKLSETGNIEIWRQLGFDPVRVTVWDDPALKEENKFTDYFGPNIFDTLIEVKDEIRGVNVGEKMPDVSTAVQTQVMVRALNDMEDPSAVLKQVADELR